MGQAILVARDQTNAPLNLLVQRDGGITGLTVDIKIFNGNNLSQFLDFNDGVFKDAGHTTDTLTLPAIQATEFPGMYSVDTGFDLSAITVPAAAASLLVRYEITAGGEVGEDFDTLIFNDVVRDAVLSDATTFAGANVDVAISTRSDFDETTDPVELLDTGGAAGTSAEELVDDVWDELNRGADHNIKDSTGKQQRQASSGGIDVDTQPVASLGGASTVELDASESAIDDFILHRYIAITAGTGVGQGRIISAYDGTTKIATVSRPWDVIPDATSFYVLLLLGDTFVTTAGINADAIATDAIDADALAADAVAEIADGVWDEDIVLNHGGADTAGLLVRALGAGISQRSNNDTLEELLGVVDSAGVDLPEQVNTELEVTQSHGAGAWTSGGGLTQQQARDAMKLAPTGGAPAAGSIDEHLDDILTDTAVIEPLVSTNLDATVSSRGTADPGDAMDLIAGAVDAAAIATDAIDADALAADAVAEIQSGLATAAAVALLETEASAATREATNTAEHGATLTAVGLNETEVAAAAREVTNTAEHALTQSTGGPGPWTTFAGGGGLTAQQTRDSMKLAPTGGAPAAGSVDEHLDDILADTAAGGAGPWATAAGFETEVSAAARAVTNQAEHDATQAAVALVETEAAAAAREATNTAEHGTTLTAVGLNETEAAAAIRSAADAVAHALTQSTGGPGPWTTGAGVGPQAIRDAMKLAPTAGAPAAGSVDEHLDTIEADTAAIEPLVTTNLDATTTSRESEAAASARAATAAAAHAALSVEHSALAVGIAAGETEVAAAGREVTNTAEHGATLTAVGLNESEADAATRAAVVTKLRKETTNRTEIDLATQEEIAYDDDGTTPIQRWDVDTDGGELATTQLGVITKRGPPKL